eukprot:4314095-Prymnesium_polylepis.1
MPSAPAEELMYIFIDTVNASIVPNKLTASNSSRPFCKFEASVRRTYPSVKTADGLPCRVALEQGDSKSQDTTTAVCG